RSGSWHLVSDRADGSRRQFDEKCAALAGLRLRLDASAVAPGDLLRDRQSQTVASALVGAVQALERQEQLVSITHVETAPAVAHRQPQAVAFARAFHR